MVVSVKKHFAEGWIQREIAHISSHWRKVSAVVKTSKNPKLVKRVQDVVFWGRIHEIKVKQVLNSKRLQKEHDIAQICTLNFWRKRTDSEKREEKKENAKSS